MKPPRNYYRQRGLKPVMAFVSLSTLSALKRLSKDADKSLTRYVTRLLESHVAEKTHKS